VVFTEFTKNWLSFLQASQSHSSHSQLGLETGLKKNRKKDFPAPSQGRLKVE
jgi:hypothetical protein